MKLEPKYMLAFGFKPTHPDNSPDTTWWEHKELDLMYWSLPTCKTFLDDVREHEAHVAVCQTQSTIKRALGL